MSGEARVSENDYSRMDAVFARNAERFEQLMRDDPDKIPGFAEFGQCRFLALDLLLCEIVFGSDSYDNTDDNLFERFGENYSLRYQIVELAR